MPKKKKKVIKLTKGKIELTKGKPRKEEEKFSTKFSKTQMTAVLLIILAATFLVQGITRYLEIIGRLEVLKPWFTVILTSLFFLTVSVVSITLGNVVSVLKTKRQINLISFGSFLLGFILFLASLLFLIFVI